MSRLPRNIRERLSQMEIGTVLQYIPRSLLHCKKGESSREIAYAGAGGCNNNDNEQLFVESKQENINGDCAIRTYLFDLKNISRLDSNSLEGKYTTCTNISSCNSPLYMQLNKVFGIVRVNKIAAEASLLMEAGK